MKCFVFLIGCTLALMLASQARLPAIVEHSQILDTPRFDQDVDLNESPNIIFGRIFGGTRTPGGVVQSEGCSGILNVHLAAKKGMTIRVALDAFIASNPDYEWLLDGGVVNLLRRTGPSLLDVKVRSFQLNTTDRQTAAQAILYDDLLRLPEVRHRAAELNLKPGIMTGGLGVADIDPELRKPIPIVLNLKDISLRQAFNSVARAYGHTVWLYHERLCNGEHTYFVRTEND
jgi:hypothetical protein